MLEVELFDADGSGTSTRSCMIPLSFQLGAIDCDLLDDGNANGSCSVW